MQNKNEKIGKLVSAALFVLSISLLTSNSLMTGFHLLVFPAILLCIGSYDWRRFPKSGWALLLLAGVMLLSVFTNLGAYARPLKVVFKTRYYILGALSIIPLDYYFNRYLTPEERTLLLKKLATLLLLTAGVANISGLIGYLTEFNPILMRKVHAGRNTGTFGLSITYAHSMAWFSVLLIGFWTQRKKIKGFLSDRSLVFSTFLSLTGLFTSLTRGALLGFLAGCVVINRKIATLCLALFVLGFTGAALRNPDFIEKKVFRQGSNQERLGCWLGAFQAFKNRPLLGYGFMNYDSVSSIIKKEYGLPKPEFQGHAHNDLLELMASTGFFGAFLFLTWLILWFSEAWKTGGLSRSLVIPFVVAFLVSGLTQVTFSDSENIVFVMFVYAISSVFQKPKPSIS